MQFIAAGNYDTDAESAQFKEQTEIIEIAVVKRILVVPFDFQPDLAFEAVNLVGWAFMRLPVNDDGGIEFALFPSQFRERPVDSGRDETLASAGNDNPAFKQPEG